MGVELKSLKVAQLKEVLQQAGVAFTQRDKKEDLIGKISGNPKALAIANGDKDPAPAAQDDDLLAPPEDFDWEEPVASSTAPAIVPPPAALTPTVVPPPTVKPISAQKVAPAPQPAPPLSTNPLPTEPVANDVKSSEQSKEADELERRKQRAARFGIPLVEVKPAKTVQSKSSETKVNGAARHDGENKLQARAERFGSKQQLQQTASQKRERSPAPVDADEAEKRRKRAERFGAQVST